MSVMQITGWSRNCRQKVISSCKSRQKKTVDNILRKPGDVAVDSELEISMSLIRRYPHHIPETADPKLYWFGPCVYKFNQDGELMHTYVVDAIDVRPKVVLPTAFDD